MLYKFPIYSSQDSGGKIMSAPKQEKKLILIRDENNENSLINDEKGVITEILLVVDRDFNLESMPLSKSPPEVQLAVLCNVHGARVHDGIDNAGNVIASVRAFKENALTVVKHMRHSSPLNPAWGVPFKQVYDSASGRLLHAESAEEPGCVHLLTTRQLAEFAAMNKRPYPGRIPVRELSPRRR
jgi:hypothetical protein